MMMSKEILNAAINQALQLFWIFAALILIWQLYLFVRNNPKKFGLSMKRVALKKKKERKQGLARWALGSLLVLSSFAIANTFLGAMGTGEAGFAVQTYLSSVTPGEVSNLADVFFGTDFSYVGIATVILLLISGISFTLSSIWKYLRYVGDVFLGGSFLYVLLRMVQVTFIAEVNIYQMITESAYYFLSFFGFLFFVLMIVLTVKGLTAFDEKEMKMVRHRLQQMLQLGIGLIVLLISSGLIATISLQAPVPETFNSLMLDSESAVFRYSMLLYLFGASIFLRQLLPYFRYVLMGLLSLSSAYIVFDAVNYFV
jgi:hypothetical protein